MFSTLALCLSLHTSGPVALAALLTDGTARAEMQTVAAKKRSGKKPVTTKPPPRGPGRGDPRTKPGLEIPPRGVPGHGGGPF